MYHYVRDAARSRYPGINGLSVDQFKGQLEYIGRHYEVIGAQELSEAIMRKQALPANAMLLTFDDGYKDHFETVFPILDQMGLTACFFPVGKAVRENVVLDV